MVSQSFEEITQLVVLGQYLEAKTSLSKLNEEELSFKDKITYKILNYQILIGLYKFSEALLDIDSTIKIIKQNELEKELFQILSVKSFAMQFIRKFDESLECVNEGIEKIEKLSKEKQQLYSIEYAYLFLHKGYAYFWLKEYDETLDLAIKAKKIFEEKDFLIGIGETLTLMGLVYYGRHENITKAIEFIDEGLAIFEDLKVIHLMLNSYYYLGRLFYHKGQIHQSLSYTDKMLHLVKKYNDDYRLGVFLLTSSILLAEIGKYKSAEKNALASLKHIENFSRSDINYLIYYRLFIITINQNKISEAKNHLKRLYTLKEEFSDLTDLHDVILLAEAQLEMKKETIQETNKAKSLLNEVIVKQRNRKDKAMEARYYLCNILLQEYLDSGEKEILSRLNKLTNEILEFGKKDDLIGFRIKANHIRLLIVWIHQLHSSQTPKNTKVEELLLDVQLIAEKHNLSTITKQFTDQQMKLLQQKQTLEEFTKAYYFDTYLV